MNLIRQASELAQDGRAACVAIGMFDGVHLGHQRILGDTLSEARRANGVSVAITFDQHPNAVVAPAHNPPLIYSLAQRLRVIRSMGIDRTWLITFDREFSQQTAETFVSGFVRAAGHVQTVSIGSDFTFGYQRQGNVALLKALGAQLGFGVHDLPPVTWRGEVISSTRIREAIRVGDFSVAGQLLGRPYAVAGVVMQGEQLGRKIGFPTANLDVRGLGLPPVGVYGGYARVGGQSHGAVANLGFRPSVAAADQGVRLEVHLLDFEEDLYGQEVEFEFVHPLRAENKFPSIGALQAQIAKDVIACRALLDPERK